LLNYEGHFLYNYFGQKDKLFNYKLFNNVGNVGIKGICELSDDSDEGSGGHGSPRGAINLDITVKILTK
jgi:hypothetical protein